MVKEYASIMKNDVWEVLSRPEGNSMVTSKLLYMIKYVADGSVEKTKLGLWRRGSHRLRELTMMRPSLQLLGTF